MTYQQPKALWLADALESRRELSPTHYINQSASELRRLYAANLDCIEWYEAVKSERDDLLVALNWMIDVTDEGGFPSGACLQKARAVVAKAKAKGEVK